ncbi:glycerol kinase GlpK [Thermoplasma sp. Kam2015]|uniref:glycerol kinase GlpK n=1 Tax=Thermoplasma sp. Kam2015 TaxID=2094122 RepID=UPI001F01EB4B|nr:glycerol kinase GlpK [Thermoplasma sp. Kam2015]
MVISHNITEKKYVMSIDVGTTGTRTAIIDENGHIVSFSYRTNRQYFPAPGWVEQDPSDLWENVRTTMKEAITSRRIDVRDIASAGITNQRETLIVWDRHTGRPLYNAIVWQDKRTAPIIKDLDMDISDTIITTTGLRPDAYFSASKVKWLLDHVDGLRSRMKAGEAVFGTVDAWIIWNLTYGRKGSRNQKPIFATDHSNASRTMIYDISRLRWDHDLMELFGGIDENSLPQVNPSGSPDAYGHISDNASTIFEGREISITSDLGDQQAALFGQVCFDPGDMKITYGTGTFALANAGHDIPRSSARLLKTIFYSLHGGRINYALEGSILASGSALRWLENGIHMLGSAKEIEDAAQRVRSNEGVYFVPAFSGLGSPYWDQDARGLFIGLTERTSIDHLARAILESEVYMATDVIRSVEEETGSEITKIKCDGGGSRSDFLMQFQADMANSEVLIPETSETTVIGSGYLSGLTSGFWTGLNEIRELWRLGRIYRPGMKREERERLYVGWREAVKRSMGWASSIR